MAASAAGPSAWTATSTGYDHSGIDALAGSGSTWNTWTSSRRVTVAGSQGTSLSTTRITSAAEIAAAAVGPARHVRRVPSRRC